MRCISKYLYLGLGFVMICFGCSPDEKKFRLVPSDESGIHFRNTLTETPEFNIFNYMYFYNGGGVATGDLNGDGLPDIYFTSNQNENALYLNNGQFKFTDVTAVSGVGGFKGWTTGVTMADVNSDGKLDIYVSYVGDYLIYKGRNQLFINQGNNNDGVPIFKDKAVQYGLDLTGFSTQASFFDYDRDGDLDLFMLNHSLHQAGTFGKSNLRTTAHPLAGDRLMRNDNGRFVDVTASSGIFSSVLGYGLGVVVSDMNLDGWPDIYVGNDFHENDYLYVNQKNGTFREELEKAMMHSTRYTMGVDFADFNNDAFPDLIAMDMLPSDPKILKASQAEDPYDVYHFKLNYGYNHQFARNVLQLNNQNGTFSDIALHAGVYATDWSWATLFADFDLDGRKDIFVANGIYRRSNDLDYINYIVADSIQIKLHQNMTDKELVHIEKMPQIKIPNSLFVNNGDSTFTDKAAEWGLGQISYSNGAAYADLDNDGDLDIVVNNIEDEAFLYENNTIGKKAFGSKEANYLRIELQGKPGNNFGIGAKVFLYDNNALQMQECMPTRGYQSAVDHRLTFGTTDSEIDSLCVVWNDGSFQTIRNVKTNQVLKLDQNKASGSFDYSIFRSRPAMISRDTSVTFAYKHRENRFFEFNREQLMPHMVSAEGPASAVGDINGDGLDDVFVGGGKWQIAKTFIQQPNGSFTVKPQSVLTSDSTYEDVDAIMFDADGDGDNDLFVVSGGNEFSGESPYMDPRLYLNDGKGNLERSGYEIKISGNGGCVAAADYDSDGDVDIFLGSRSLQWRYGSRPDSYIFTNDGKGKFSDATSEVLPALRKFGFVKDAQWVDLDNDRDPDLVVAAEWRPLTFFVNNNGALSPVDSVASGIGDAKGWWNTVHADDFDGDGDMDLVAGNLGLNSKLTASADRPVRMYVSDFDQNGSLDQVISHYINGQEYPLHTRDEMTKQMPYLKKRYLSYRKFADATIRDMFEEDALQASEKFEANMFQSSYFENLGNMRFRITHLPRAAQFSTVNAVLTDDFNNDGLKDIMLAGNFYPINIQMGRNDSSYGLILLGDGKGRFRPVSAARSGFVVAGETRALRKLRIGNSIRYLAVRNSDSLAVFKSINTPL